MHIIKQQGTKDMITRQQSKVKHQLEADIARINSTHEEQLFEIFKKRHPQRRVQTQDNFHQWKLRNKHNINSMLAKAKAPTKPLDVTSLQDTEDMFETVEHLTATPLRNAYNALFLESIRSESHYRQWLRTQGRKKAVTLDSMLTKADIELPHLTEESVLYARRAAALNEEAMLSYCAEVYAAKARDYSFKHFVKAYGGGEDVLTKRGDISYFKSFHENSVKLLRLAGMLNTCSDLIDTKRMNDTGVEINA